MISTTMKALVSTVREHERVRDAAVVGYKFTDRLDELLVTNKHLRQLEREMYALRRSVEEDEGLASEGD